MPYDFTGYAADDKLVKYRAAHITDHSQVDEDHYQFYTPSYFDKSHEPFMPVVQSFGIETSAKDVVDAMVVCMDEDLAGDGAEYNVAKVIEAIDGAELADAAQIVHNAAKSGVLGFDILDLAFEKPFTDEDEIFCIPSPLLHYNQSLRRSLSIGVAYITMNHIRWAMLRGLDKSVYVHNQFSKLNITNERAIVACERQMRFKFDMCEVVVE